MADKKISKEEEEQSPASQGPSVDPDEHNPHLRSHGPLPPRTSLNTALKNIKEEQAATRKLKQQFARYATGNEQLGNPIPLNRLQIPPIRDTYIPHHSTHFRPYQHSVI